MFCKPSITRRITTSIKRILINSDMLTTRATVATSSMTFAGILLAHAYENSYGWFWIALSLIHGITSFWSLLCDKINKLTFVGVAVLGFILWNYISMLVITSAEAGRDFYPIDAPFAPTFVVGMATWWILARYPTIRNRRRNGY